MISENDKARRVAGSMTAGATPTNELMRRVYHAIAPRVNALRHSRKRAVKWESSSGAPFKVVISA
jgi:hypothetical protein